MSETSAKTLNQLLADTTVFYQKLRTYHWLVKGELFFELHVKFEELYDYWAIQIDAIAERVLSAGGTPLGTLKAMLAESAIKEAETVPDGKGMVADLISDLETLVKKLADGIAAAEDSRDRATANLLDAIKDEQEKTLWMLKSYLGR